MSNNFGSIDNIILQDYNEIYPILFEQERQLLLQLLSHDITTVEHIGSTVLPGIKGKPVIDMQAGLANFPLSPEKIGLLISAGYVYWENDPDPNHQFFLKGMPRTHHLHFYPAGFNKLKEHILFRDYLLKHHETAVEYEQLKIALADKYANDREAYTNSKTEFINRVLAKC
jgi:GrpB-like predicted nucleotidyltransferase (UPF0157 family)